MMDRFSAYPRGQQLDLIALCQGSSSGGAPPPPDDDDIEVKEETSDDAGPLFAEYSAPPVDGAVASELAALDFLLENNVQRVNAGVVESSVINRCETQVELQRVQMQLGLAAKDVAQLESRQQSLATRAAGALASSSSSTRSTATADLSAELGLARERRSSLELHAQNLRRRSFSPLAARGSASHCSASSSSRAQEPSSRRSWGKLLGAVGAPGPPGGPAVQQKRLVMDLDSDDDGSDDDFLLVAPEKAPKRESSLRQGELSPSKAASSSSSSAPPLLSAPTATVSCSDFLKRFRKKAEVANAEEAREQARRRRRRSSDQRLVAEELRAEAEGEAVARSPAVPVKEEALERAPILPKLEEESRDRREAKVEAATKCETQGSSEKRSYRIDANQLVPKMAVDSNRWRDANPSEYRAITAQPEIVSPHRNLLKRLPGFKKKRRTTGEDGEEEESKKRQRRDDDTSEKAFRRRQMLWMKGSRGNTKALAPKNQEAKREVKCEVGEAGAEDVVKSEVHTDSLLQEDVRVDEGLRCPKWLWEALYPYQQHCISWLWSLQNEKMGGILADEMGLGKTVQIAAYLAVLHHSGVLQKMRVQNTSLGTALPAMPGGVLILCPATLIAQWKSELHTWYPPLRVCVMHQVDAEERKESIRIATTEQGVLITSYETMRIAQDELLEAHWVLLVLDEGQKIRNPHANVTIAVKQFSTVHRIILSGSPIQNSLQELWSLFDFICPGRLGTLPVFLEEFAHPIEAGNLVSANQAKVTTAYQCAMALRELTMPCILRRMKCDFMDILQLPHKQEQVLFCNLTPEQYQVYVDFLQTDQCRRAMNASGDRKSGGAAFFAISVLRKLCNHPDLLLRDADPELQPPDMGNPERSGKMKVLSSIMGLWHKEGHRALIFVQTVQMLEVIQKWLGEKGYVHKRIDGKTPVKARLRLIEEFNDTPSIFCMLLTTRVGGVGLNIIGANRVVIFDPDWNPMTDVQARERTWRIGQKKEVAVYRLVLTGTLEEKIYQRQVYKHFLSQKVLNDPRQRQFFKFNDLADLFDLPPVPPNFDPKELAALKEKYKVLFKRLGRYEESNNSDDHTTETTEVMKQIADLPTTEHNSATKESKDEHGTLLATLYEKDGIKASFNHDKVEQPLLDRKIVRDGANMIAQRAIQALKKSARECASHRIGTPTWTGSRGSAGAPVGPDVKREIKKEPGTVGAFPGRGGAFGGSSSSSSWTTSGGGIRGPISADILSGLRQLAAIRSMADQRNHTQATHARRLGIPAVSALKQPPVVKSESSGAPETPGTPCPGTPATADSSVGLAIELHESDRRIAASILSAFLEPQLAGPQHRLTTGEVLEHLASRVPAHHGDLFKTLLKQMCELSKPAWSGENSFSKQSNGPGVWSLRREFWPPGKG